MTIGRIPSVEGGIQPTIVDAKGDLIAGVAADSINRLAVGSNDQVLVADSSASTGLAWKSYGAQIVAGKNAVINGAFDFWQRGTSATYTSGTQNYLADRWFSWISGTFSVTVSQQTFTPGTAPVAGYEGQYFLRHAVSSVSGQSIQAVGQRIEDVRTFAGQTVTLSFWAKADASRTYTTRLVQNFGSGGSGEVTASGGSHSVTTSWQRFTATISVPSISGKTVGTSSYLMLLIDGPVNTANTLDIWGVQLEAGNVATPFSRAAGTLQGELAACQRYYHRFSASDGYAYFTSGNAQSTTEVYCAFPLGVTMRTKPTAIDTSGMSTIFLEFDNTSNVQTPTAIILGPNAQAPDVAQLTLQKSGAFVSGRFYRVVANNSTTAYIGFSAEL